MPLTEIADLAAHLPYDSAVNQAADPDWWITGEVSLLREVEHAARMAVWIHTKDATLNTPAQRPERIPLTKQAQLDARPEAEKYDRISIEEANRLLGWDDPKK